MSQFDPLRPVVVSEQCTATSKRTRRRCGQLVPGGGVCRWHGGAAGQVERQREARVVVAAARRMYAEDYAEREPGEVLLAAVRDVDAIVQKIKTQVERREELSGTDLLALGDWLDRAAKLAKTALDAGVQERQVRLAEAQGALVADVIRGTLTDLGHDPADPRVLRIVSTRLRALTGAET